MKKKGKKKMDEPIYIYVSGPYTKGDVVLNIRKAIQVAEKILEMGYIPYLPHTTHLWHLASPHTWEYWLALDLAWIEKCDGLLRISGESEGADLEVSKAKDLNKPVFSNIDQIDVYHDNVWKKKRT